MISARNKSSVFLIFAFSCAVGGWMMGWHNNPVGIGGFLVLALGVAALVALRPGLAHEAPGA